MMNHPTARIGLLALLAAFVFTLLPGRAEAQEVQLEGRVATTYPNHASFDAVSPRNYNASGGVGVALGLDEWLLSGLRAYVGYNGGSAAAGRFAGDLGMDWGRTQVLAGADWGPTIAGFMRPYVRVTAGLAVQNLTLTHGAQGDSVAGDTTYKQTTTNFVTRDSVGLELHLPYGDPDSQTFGISEHFTLGLTGQFGVLWQTDANFDDLEAQNGGANSSWEPSGVDLGSLNANGAFWDVGAFIRARF